MNRSRPERLPKGGFLELLTRHMTESGVTKKQLSKLLGISEAHVYSWFKEKLRSWPNLDDVEALADHFEDETLLSRAIADRTRNCRLCKAQFVAKRQHQVYCTLECGERARHIAEGRSKHQRLTYRVKDLEETIAAMCRACEPNGVCRQPECPIQVRGKGLPLAVPRGESKVVFIHQGPIPVRAARS